MEKDDPAPKKITDEQVADVELHIKNILNGSLPKALGLEQNFQKAIRFALEAAMESYDDTLKFQKRQKPATKRQMVALEKSISKTLIALSKDEVRASLTNTAPCGWSLFEDEEAVDQASLGLEMRKKGIGEQIDDIIAALTVIRNIVRESYVIQPKNVTAISTLQTEAITNAATMFHNLMWEWDLPSRLWHQDMTPSKLAQIIAEALQVIGIKASERQISELWIVVNPQLDIPRLIVKPRARGKQR